MFLLQLPDSAGTEGKSKTWWQIGGTQCFNGPVITEGDIDQGDNVHHSPDM